MSVCMVVKLEHFNGVNLECFRVGRVELHSWSLSNLMSLVPAYGAKTPGIISVKPF